MRKQVLNFIEGNRLSKDFHNMQEARNCITNPATAAEMRKQGIDITPHINLLGTEYRALNTTESDVNAKGVGAVVNRGVFNFIDNVVNDPTFALGHFASLDAVQKPAEGAAWDDDVDGDADADTNATDFVMAESNPAVRYAWRTEASDEVMVRNVNFAEALMDEVDSLMGRKIGVDAVAAISAAATATGNAFSATEVCEQFLLFGENYRFVGSPAQAYAVRKALVDMGAQELAPYANAFEDATEGFGWKNSNVALVMPKFTMGRDQFSKAIEGKLVFNASAVANTIALAADKFAAS